MKDLKSTCEKNLKFKLSNSQDTITNYSWNSQKITFCRANSSRWLLHVYFV